MSKYKSKLPKNIQKALIKEFDGLVNGINETKNVKIEFIEPVNIQYSWEDGYKATYNMPDINGWGLGDKCISIIEKNLKKDISIKLREINDKIKDFNKKLKDLCAKYNCDEEKEFLLISGF